MSMETVGVAGLGLLGRSIVSCLLAHGLKVLAYTSAAEFPIAHEAIARSIDELVARAGLPGKLRTGWPGRYHEAIPLDELAACDFVIESIVEAFEAKAALFDRLEELLPTTVTIASNT